MKKLLLALALLLIPTAASAQCTGVFPANTFCGNNTGSPKPPGPISASSTITGPATSAVGDLALWNNLTGSSLKDQAPGAFTSSNDTNVTITLGGAASTALVNAMSITMGWTGTLAAARLNANVVQAITNDTNITGSITAQNLSLGWTGTLAAGRLNGNVVQSFVNDTNVTASITSQAATLGWTGTLALTRGGTGASTQSGAANAILPTPSEPGDIVYWNGSAWVILAGNGTGTQLLSENSTGVPSWVTVSGTGTVTAITQGHGLTFSTTPCTSTCTIGLTTPIASADGGTGVGSPTIHTIPINEGSSAQNNTGVGTIGQYIGSTGSADPAFTSGPWTLLVTLTANNTATTLTDTTHITSAYSEYEIVLEQILPATGSNTLELQVQVSSFQTSSYLSTNNNANGSATGSTAITTGVQVSTSGNVPNTGAGVSGRYYLSNPSQTLTCKHIHGDYVYAISSAIQSGTSGGCYNGGSSAITGIQLTTTAGGNLTSGVMKIYGRL